MKILNLYANIGGNRKLWGDEHQITAIEIKPEVANVYKDFFPHDRVLVEDAHAYLLAHYEEYDFIWSSPPCPTHSQLGRLRAFNKHNVTTGQYSPPRYPDMTLYGLHPVSLTPA
jgi:DNA (cytosine-5)-methyltransferase 1